VPTPTGHAPPSRLSELHTPLHSLSPSCPPTLFSFLALAGARGVAAVATPSFAVLPHHCVHHRFSSLATPPHCTPSFMLVSSHRHRGKRLIWLVSTSHHGRSSQPAQSTSLRSISLPFLVCIGFASMRWCSCASRLAAPWPETQCHRTVVATGEHTPVGYGPCFLA
jgi:hypothetical protein